MTFWSTNVSSDEPNTLVCQLRDNGNLVLRPNGNVNALWRSFDYPTDVFLPEMSFPIDLFNGTFSERRVVFRSWRNPSNPSGGSFRLGIKNSDSPELVLWNDDETYWRNGPWNGNLYVGVNSVLSIVPNAGKVYIGFSLANASSGLSHYVLNYDGSLIERNWDTGSRKWKTVWNALPTECDIYGKCGPFGSCKAENSPICSCLRGFVPYNNTEWRRGNWTGGCVRSSLLRCGKVGATPDGFWKLKNVKVPEDSERSSTNNEDECSSQCLRKCSCVASAFYSSIGCLMWNSSLIHIQEFSDGRGLDLFVRLAHSELGISNQQPQKTDVSFAKKYGGWIVIPVVVALITVAGISLRRKNGTERAYTAMTVLHGDQSDTDFGDIPMFELHELMTATNNFEESNKLGRGGFGILYKGQLENGVEVAVKRLSKVSGQGLAEFMTEVLVISKLQHRNLVRLLGCCVEGDVKLLVYEYMPNKSLDALLFDRLHQELLDWKMRFSIIQGICRGLLYLHRDSRLKIIHRDLKAGNVLLDDKLNPKISDFGMARIFGGNEDQADTKRVVGTYGYMSPEYAMEGRFSEKSDVFSFGMLLLEIVSGRRNSSFKDDECLSLLGYAWKLWNEDDIVSLIDPEILESGFQDEILRCIQVALLCVQELPEDRPNMSMVISMIDSEVANLPRPTQPGFTQRRSGPRNQTLQDEYEYDSVNRITLSHISGR